ncbi:MAG: carboxypeptidase-like regulatory domain-containing protein [Candidatus Micrarchaeota archaeon]|nr:carboxypeptidase-like regulatory domain-containing protein [Candidatus Micrarchaeota archaeon]
MRLSAFFLLLAAGVLVLTGAPWAKYTENLTVQVFDNFLRPVEGAQVYVDYELNSVKGNIETKPKLTDSHGYAGMLFTNYESIDSETEYSYTLYVKYGDQLDSASLIAVDGENRIYTMQVESYIALVRVFDQNGHPLQANATVGRATKPTDSSGSTFFALPPGNYALKVERNDLVKNIPLAIANSTGDQSIDVMLSYYKLDVHVQDDRRHPLSANVEVNGAGSETDSDGMAHFENITINSPQVIVTYGQGIKRVQPNLQASPSLEVTFDLSKPSIKDQYSALSSSGVGMIRFFVEDVGPEASGIDAVSVSYEVAGVQNALSVYAIGYNSFEAKIPAQPAGTLVKYTISVSDKEGNTAVGHGDYVVSLGGGAPGAANTSSPGASMPSMPSIPNEGIFVGIAVLAVSAFAAIYYFNKKKGGEIPPPPLAPPMVPQQ